MKKTIACAAVAACVLLSGCASTDVRPEESPASSSDLMEQLVTRPSTASASGGVGSEPELPVESGSSPQTSSAAPTA